MEEFKNERGRLWVGAWAVVTGAVGGSKCYFVRGLFGKGLHGSLGELLTLYKW